MQKVILEKYFPRQFYNCLFFVYFSPIQENNTVLNSKLMSKNDHPLSCAGIRTHNLFNESSSWTTRPEHPHKYFPILIQKLQRNP